MSNVETIEELELYIEELNIEKKNGQTCVTLPCNLIMKYMNFMTRVRLKLKCC